MNWWGIRTLQFFGLAKSIKLIDKSLYLPVAESDTMESTLSKAA
jgi:hypothetical protein